MQRKNIEARRKRKDKVSQRRRDQIEAEENNNDLMALVQ
jgi:hypothetical protein